MRASTPLCLEEQKFDPEHPGPGASCRSCLLLCRSESWFEARSVQHVCPFWGRGMRVDTPPCLEEQKFAPEHPAPGAMFRSSSFCAGTN